MAFSSLLIKCYIFRSVVLFKVKLNKQSLLNIFAKYLFFPSSLWGHKEGSRGHSSEMEFSMQDVYTEE